MPGFNYTSRRAVDPREPIPLRYVMFIQTCSAFRGLCGFPITMQKVHDVLGELYGFSREVKPTPEQIVLAVATMVAARFHLLYLLREAERARHHLKLAGDRRKVPSPFTPQQALDSLRRFSAVGRR